MGFVFLNVTDLITTRRSIDMIKKGLIMLISMLWCFSAYGECLKKGCHKTIDSLKALHTPLKEGSCEDCHTKTEKHKFSVNARGKELCLGCHENPIKEGESPHSAVSDGECTDCHSPHGSVSKKWKNLKEKLPELCYGCHEKFEGDFLHSPVITGDCLRCHKPHSSSNRKLLVKEGKELCFICHYDDLSDRAHIHPAIEEGCIFCHLPHSANFSKLLSESEKEICYKCHENKEGEKVVHGILKKEGCSPCHNPHGSDYDKLLPSSVNDLCSKCHRNQSDGSHIFSGIRGLHPVMGVRDPSTQKALTCVSCHNPHSSPHPKLFYEGESKLEMCKKCHKRSY